MSRASWPPSSPFYSAKATTCASRDLKIIMLSAKGRDAEVTKGLSLGADVYITKPFSTRDLMAKIHGLLESGSASGEPRS